MNKFKVGDKVKIKDSSKQGVIQLIDFDHIMRISVYLVLFDAYEWHSEEKLELVADEPQEEE